MLLSSSVYCFTAINCGSLYLARCNRCLQFREQSLDFMYLPFMYCPGEILNSYKKNWIISIYRTGFQLVEVAFTYHKIQINKTTNIKFINGSQIKATQFIDLVSYPVIHMKSIMLLIVIDRIRRLAVTFHLFGHITCFWMRCLN